MPSDPGTDRPPVSDRDLLAVYHEAPVGIGVVSFQGAFLHANDLYAAIVGRTVPGLLALRFQDVTHPDDLASDLDQFERLKAGQINAYTMEKRFVRPDGSVLWAQLHSSALALAAGQPAILRILQDISERKRAEADLRNAEARKGAILRSALDCIISMDRDGRISDFNPAAERTFGWNAPDVVGRILADIIIPERYREAHRRGLEHFLRTGEGPLLGRRVEVVALRRDGAEFPCELAINVAIVQDEPFFTAYLRDISERRAAEAALAARTAELTRVNADLEDLTAIAAHDLKEPLRGLSTGLDFLQEDLGPDVPPAVRERIDALKRLVRRAYDQLDAIMSYIRAGRGELRIQPVPLARLAREAAEQIEPLRAFHAGVIEIDPALPVIACDPTVVRQVLANLFANAFKYNRAQVRRVALDTVPGSDPAVLRIRDNGIGIPERHRETVFRMFKRLHAADAFGGGTGVGLPFAKRIIERHGGRIQIQGQPGEGTTVLFTLAPEPPPLPLGTRETRPHPPERP